MGGRGIYPNNILLIPLPIPSGPMQADGACAEGARSRPKLFDLCARATRKLKKYIKTCNYFKNALVISGYNLTQHLQFLLRN